MRDTPGSACPQLSGVWLGLWASASGGAAQSASTSMLINAAHDTTSSFRSSKVPLPLKEKQKAETPKRITRIQSALGCISRTTPDIRLLLDLNPEPTANTHLMPISTSLIQDLRNLTISRQKSGTMALAPLPPSDLSQPAIVKGILAEWFSWLSLAAPAH